MTFEWTDKYLVAVVVVVQSLSLTLCDPKDCSTPGFPRVCWSLCPLSPWCHPTISSYDAIFSFSLQSSQHQGLLQWVGSSRQVTKILELQLQHQSFQWVFRLISLMIDWFDLLAVQGTLQKSSPAPQFKSIQYLFSPMYNGKIFEVYNVKGFPW